VFFILFLGIIIFKEFLPFLSGILGALTVYILVRKQMWYLTDKKKFKNSIAAILIVIESVLCFLVPMFLAVWLLLGRLDSFDLNPNSFIANVQAVVNAIQHKTGYDFFSGENIKSATTYGTRILQAIIGEVSSFIINSVVLIFMLYFMLVGSKKMEAYLYDIMPFNNNNKGGVISKIKVMVISNAIGIPLLAIVQGFFAFIGYMIFGTPSPLFFAFITCFATIIPLIGTALVWLPLAVYLAATGNWPAAIGLTLYSLIVISNIDNLVRFLLQKKIADTHPLITVFGVIIGLTLFGFWGVIFGPLLLSMFLLCVDMFKKEYLDAKKE